MKAILYSVVLALSTTLLLLLEHTEHLVPVILVQGFTFVLFMLDDIKNKLS